MQIKKLRIKNCVLALFVLGFIFGACMGLSKEAHAEAEQEMHRIVVRSGDTLWSLTETYCNYDGDIRSAIYNIKRINHLKSSELFAGQIIYIPYSL